MIIPYSAHVAVGFCVYRMRSLHKELEDMACHGVKCVNVFLITWSLNTRLPVPMPPLWDGHCAGYLIRHKISGPRDCPCEGAGTITEMTKGCCI